MAKHPANDWEWEDDAEIKFQEWFNDLYGNYSHRCEWFYGDCLESDVNQRKEILTKWLHSAFLTGYNTGRCSNSKGDFFLDEESGILYVNKGWEIVTVDGLQ